MSSEQLVRPHQHLSSADLLNFFENAFDEARLVSDANRFIRF